MVNLVVGQAGRSGLFGLALGSLQGSVALDEHVDGENHLVHSFRNEINVSKETEFSIIQGCELGPDDH